MFLGIFDLDATLTCAVPITDGDGVPVDPTNAPTFRIYDGEALLQTGVATQLDTGVVSGATNASPIVITDTAHGLKDNNVVKVTGVGGNTAANATWTVTRVSADTFSLNSSTGNGTYTSGGVWHVLGLYQLSQVLSTANGFASGGVYQIYVNYNDGSSRVKQFQFQVA
jgi:hypothetical protein